jgi:hypothetical protein
MTRSFLILGFLLFFGGCDGQNGETATYSKATDTIPSFGKTRLSAQVSPKPPSSILGAWTDGSTENATFDIQKDSIFYVDQLESYPYHLNGDNISIQYADYKYEAKISWIQDTLVLTDKGKR